MAKITVYLAGEIHSGWRDELRREHSVTVESLSQAAAAIAYIFA